MIALEIAKRVQRWKWIFSPDSIFLVDFFLREKEQSALNSHLWVIAAFNLLLHSQHHRPTILSVSLWLSHYFISLYHISYIRQPPTNNIVSVSIIITLLYITTSYIIYQATTNQQHCQCRWHQHQLQHYYRHIHTSVWCTVWWWSDENVWSL